MGNTGEIRRAFFRHVAFGDVVVVEIDETGLVLATSSPVTSADVCKHRLSDYTLMLSFPPVPGGQAPMWAATSINRHRKDWELFEPLCSDPAHQLHDIFEADRAVDAAEATWAALDADAKAAKKLVEKLTEKARDLRRELRDPRELPLFPRERAS